MDRTDHPPMSAAVLAGGLSRRMGRDKALLEVDGVPLIARVLETLRRISDDVMIVGARDVYRQFGIAVIDDQYPGGGALGGIATALAHSVHAQTLVVACDMPFLSVRLLQAMVNVRGDEDVLVPVISKGPDSSNDGPRFETLHAIYSRRCLDAVVNRIHSGDLRVTAFYDDVRVRTLDEQWVRMYDPELASFVNTNDPDELAVARRRYTRDPQLLEDGMTDRDYSKFLREDGTLNVRLIPRPVYTKLVNEYRRQEHVIRQVLEEQFWLWDLEEAERRAAAEGVEVSSAELAQKVLDNMEDDDWWKCMAAYEQHLVTHFRESPAQWAELLDPVYDEQEEAGWVERQ